MEEKILALLNNEDTKDIFLNLVQREIIDRKDEVLDDVMNEGGLGMCVEFDEVIRELI